MNGKDAGTPSDYGMSHFTIDSPNFSSQVEAYSNSGGSILLML
jgi:hypothetical protein